MRTFTFTSLTCLVVTTLPLTHQNLSGQEGGPAEPATIVAAKVVKVKRSSQQTFIGTVQPIRKSMVGTAVAGRVVSVLIDAGDPVKIGSQTNAPNELPGQPLIQLRTETLKIEMGAAKIQLQIAQDTLTELLTKLPTDLELAQAKASETSARYRNAEAEFRRVEKMKDSISGLELDQARLKYQINRQLSTAAAIALKQFEATKNIRISQAKSGVAAAEQELLRLSNLQEKYTIRAPFDGFVTQKLTEVGDWAAAGQSLVEVVQLNPIDIVINVPQSQIYRLQQSMAAGIDAAEVSIDGVDNSFTGKIDRIVPRADLKSRTFPVRIRIENQKLGKTYVIQPGMLGRTVLGLGKEIEMLMVKKDALVLGTVNPVLWVVDPQTTPLKVSRVSVKTGETIGEWIQVIGNLSENDIVVLQGNERLRAGQSVTITKMETDSVPKK